MGPSIFKPSSENLSHDEIMRSPTRRSFLDRLIRFFSGGLFVLALYPVARFLYPRGIENLVPGEIVRLADVRDLPEGTSLKTRYQNYPIIVLHHGEVFYAYGAVCTHQGCLIHWKDRGEITMHMGEELHCPCHGGRYDPVTGRVIAGPPPNPLPKLQTSIVGNNLFALGWEKPGYATSLRNYQQG